MTEKRPTRCLHSGCTKPATGWHEHCEGHWEEVLNEMAEKETRWAEADEWVTVPVEMAHHAVVVDDNGAPDVHSTTNDLGTIRVKRAWLDLMDQEIDR